MSNHVDVKMSHVVFISFPKSRVSKDKLDFVKNVRRSIGDSVSKISRDTKGRVALSRVSIFTHVDPYYYRY